MAQLKPVPPAQPSATPSGTPPGQPLPPTLRHQYEAQMGQDFSDVRIHQNHGPTMVGTNAYTQGTDIHFAPGAYQPHDPRSNELLGHELTHVVQQRQGRVQPHHVPNGMVRVE